MADIISKAIEDSNISIEEFKNVLKEVEKFREIKDEIRTKTDKNPQDLTKKQHDEIFKLGKKQRKKDFLEVIANTSATQPANAI